MSTPCYTGQCVVVFGAASLQRYIFQSNRLKENIGASYLVKRCLEDDLIETIQHSHISITTTAWDTYKADMSEECSRVPETEDPVDLNVDVNLIYVGGGNAALLCKNRDIANKVVKAWSCKLLKDAPELRVIVGYGMVEVSLAEAYRHALEDVTRCEEALPFGTPLGSLPVVRTCVSTGFPASMPSKELYETDQWVSQATDRKREAAENSVTDELKSVLRKGQRFAIRPEDELGGSEGQSYIAVVHADGNGMGRWLNEVIDAPQHDDEFLHNLRAFSVSVSHQSLRALTATLHHLQEALPRLKDDLAVNTSEIFPLRPIVYGGDDLTFVCDGRLGLHLSAYYLREFAKSKIWVLGKYQSVDACAGVAIVPTKFPFAQAYGFADELCGLAKARRQEQGNPPCGSWLDFQIIQEGVTQSITALREAQYRSFEGQKLHQRPYEVPGSWDDFTTILQGFQSQQWPRSRAKRFLHALTQGPTATERFVEGIKWRGIKLTSLKGTLPSTLATGWTPIETTPYFDPLEALDFYIAIDEENKG